MSGSGVLHGMEKLVREERAQGTLEYALVFSAFLAMVLALGALWHAGEVGTLGVLAERAAPRSLDGTGPLDFALF